MRFFHVCFFLMCFVETFACGDVNKLVVSGNASIHKPADKLTLTIGVATLDENADSAIQENGEKMEKVLHAIKETGVLENEMQTGDFTVIPQYALPPRTPPPGWQTSINNYEVRNTLTIQTGKLELAGPLIDAAAKAGANLIEDISFSLQDTQNAEAEAIAKAVRQARAYAKAAVQEAGIHLGDILEITVNQSNLIPRFLKADHFPMAAMGNATPINPGKVEITASVLITFEIYSHRD